MRLLYLIKSLIFALSIFIASCSPRPVLRLSPVSDDSEWLFGKEYSQISTEEFEVAIAFDRAYRDYIAFDIEILNFSPKTVLISPEKFFYAPSSSLEFSTTEQKVYGIDPEEMLLKIDKDLAREKSKYAFESALDATVGIIAVITDIVSDDEIETYHYDDLAIHRLEKRENHNRKLTNLNVLRDAWEFETLRKTHLQSDYEIQGKIYFPITASAEFLKINLPIDNHIIRFTFEQTSHE